MKQKRKMTLGLNIILFVLKYLNKKKKLVFFAATSLGNEYTSSLKGK